MALPVAMSTGLTRPAVSAPRPAQLRLPSRPAVRSSRLQAAQDASENIENFPKGWLNPIVLPVAFFGWTLPTMISVPALGNESLFGQFTASIGEELAHFPVGPALTDRFWTLLLAYHAGLFATLLFGQIGVNGRKQNYW